MEHKHNHVYNFYHCFRFRHDGTLYPFLKRNLIGYLMVCINIKVSLFLIIQIKIKDHDPYIISTVVF